MTMNFQKVSFYKMIRSNISIWKLIRQRTWLFYAVTICTEELSIVRLSVSLVFCLTGIVLRLEMYR